MFKEVVLYQMVAVLFALLRKIQARDALKYWRLFTTVSRYFYTLL